MTQEERKRIKLEQLGNGILDHNGLSWLCVYQKTQGTPEVYISQEEKVLLRDLAAKVARMAEESCQEEKKKRWTDHHDLKVTKPLIFIDPEYAWYEILPHTVLQSENNLARVWEYRLRKEIYWQEEIRDDRVCTKEFPVCHVYELTGMGIEPHKTNSKAADGAYHIDTVLDDFDMMGRLKFREIIVDYGKSEAIFSLAHEVFDGILDVTVNNSFWYSDGLSDELLFLRGMENMLYDFYDHPDELHALMAFLRDERMHMLDVLEKENLLTLNNGGEFVGTGGYGYCGDLPGKDFDPSHIRLRDLWGYGESQVTVSVSPEMFDEFILDYQVPILSRFGLNIYGCCEPMEKRFPYVKKKVPRLRTVAVSPWADAESLASQMRGDYVYCWKQNPALISVEYPDFDLIRKEIRKVFRITAEYGCPTEVLMRDIRTLAFHPKHAARWAQIAKEEADRIYGT